MDATDEELDIKLQRASVELIADISSSLRPLLWKTSKSGENCIKFRVRDHELSRLLGMELPQLLDPHLDKFITLLADSFLTYLQSSPPSPIISNNLLFVPVSKAICQLLYRFCKVRGEKVIIRFFSTEVKYIEILISSVEKKAPEQYFLFSKGNKKLEIKDENQDTWGWEETYISLLWLSQLFLAPFDLSSISSENTSLKFSRLEKLELPLRSPEIVLRIVPIAIHCLSSPGKENDAARYLLVRLAMRKDMQKNGTMKALVDWSILQIRSDSDTAIHGSLGALSFLASLLNLSIGTTYMETYIFSILKHVREIACCTTNQAEAINSIAVARKTIIKILRSIAIIGLQNPQNLSNLEMIESIIGDVLEGVADAATPVRLAASKALSIITFKLPSELAIEVTQTILSELDRNILWVEMSKFRRRNNSQTNLMNSYPLLHDEKQHENLKINDIKSLWHDCGKDHRLDTSRVDPLKWHGVMMTLSHLIYRRSINPQDLTPILKALRLGLSFEQRSTSGLSVGTNVRDAACFGIWALARKYSTVELQNIKFKQNNQGSYLIQLPLSTLQILASELVVSATLDPAGNIRRGSSAALQELIGRHPDTIEKGIHLVQIVDYHSVALRIKAIEVVAYEASELSDYYRRPILENLIGWRGIQYPDKYVRQIAAKVIGQLIWMKQIQVNELGPDSMFFQLIDHIVPEILLLKPREANERHGLILTFTELIKQLLNHVDKITLKENIYTILSFSRESIEPESSDIIPQQLSYIETPPGNHSFVYLIRRLLQDIISVVKEVNINQKSYRAPNLTAESICRLIIPALNMVKLNLIFQEIEQKRAILSTQVNDGKLLARKFDNSQLYLLETLDVHFSLNNENSLLAVKQYEAIVKAFQITGGPTPAFMKMVKNVLDHHLINADEEIVDILSKAAANYGLLCGPEDGWFHEWQRNAFEVNSTDQKDKGNAYIQTIFYFPMELYNLWNKRGESLASDVYKKWHTIKNIEMRLKIMRCIGMSSAIRESPFDYIELIKVGLDDYNMTYQGDVGSLLRIESLKTTVVIWEQIQIMENSFMTKIVTEIFQELVPRNLRLASEKLDRVRIEAKAALLRIPTCIEPNISMVKTVLLPLTVSSKEYFQSLLEIHCAMFIPSKYLDQFNQLIGGYVTSADGGSEDVIRASRVALINFCEGRKLNNFSVCLPSCDIKSHVLCALTFVISSSPQRLRISGLEIMAFLVSMGILNEEAILQGANILDLVDRIVQKTKVIKKIEACIKIFGAFLDIEGQPSENLNIVKKKAIHNITKILIHKYPKIRSATVDEIFFRTGLGKGVDGSGEINVQEMESIRKALLKFSCLAD